jgi:aminoglycoside phosphotransferase (APT) family kinase protein
MRPVSAPPREGMRASLDVADVPGFLLARGLLTRRDVVDGGLRVRDTSRLNDVFVVTARGRRPLVVKSGPGVAREAAVLERLSGTGELAAFLPTVVDHPDRGTLVLQTAAEARDLRRHHAGGRFSSALARRTGAALAALHAVPPGILDGIEPAGDRGAELRVHVPDLEAVHTMSAAAKELTCFVQELDDLCAAIDRLAAASGEQAVIHGDVRWDNILAVRRAGSRRWTRLSLIDWELCEPGDPAADVGAFLGEYLRAWAQSVPATDPLDPGRRLDHAGLPLRRMRPALGAFWDAYARRSGAPAHELARLLARTVDFAAVRLVTAALEEAQALGRLNARVVCLVPLGRNLLCRGGDDAARLLGLDVPQEAA